LNISDAVFSETLERHQHSLWLVPESRSYTFLTYKFEDMTCRYYCGYTTLYVAVLIHACAQGVGPPKLVRMSKMQKAYLRRSDAYRRDMPVIDN
jgi:hypothetical protein